MENFLLVDDAEHVLDRVNEWANMASDGVPGFSIMAVADEYSAMDCIREGNYTGLITDYYLSHGTSTELIREAIKRNIEVIVYSSQRNLRGLQEMFEDREIDFRVRGDSDEFYVNLAIDLTLKCRLNKIKKAIQNDLLIYKESTISLLADIVLMTGITCDEPLVLVGPKGTKKTYVAKKITEYLGCEPTVISPTVRGNLTSVKHNRILIVENYDLMQKFQRDRIKKAIKNNVFVGVIYICSDHNQVDMNLDQKRIIKLLPLYRRRSDIPSIVKNVLGDRADNDFIEYIINNNLTIDDLELIKNSDDGHRSFIEIYQDIIEVVCDQNKQRDIVKRKANRHNKIKQMINKGLSLAKIADQFGIGYQAVWKIRKEMVNEQKK